MNTLSIKEVKQTLNKLPLETINILLVGCDKNCNLKPLEDVNNSKKTLKKYQEILANIIVELNDIEIYKNAIDIIDSFTKIDNDIASINEELKPIEKERKERRDKIKELTEEKNALIHVKTKELK